MDKNFEEQVKNQVQYPIYIVENTQDEKNKLNVLKSKKKDLDNLKELINNLKRDMSEINEKNTFGNRFMVNKVKTSNLLTKETKLVESNHRHRKNSLLNILELQNNRLSILENQNLSKIDLK